jgi:hypothetical protein
MKDLSLHIMDILQNSIRSGADRIGLEIIEDVPKDLYRLTFTDNGCGMDKTMLNQVTDPFFTTRTVRKVGLGLSLLKQNAEKTGGNMTIESAVGKGTTVCATFSHKHIDRPVLGDVAGAIVLTASAYPDIRFIYRHEKNGSAFVFDTDEINKTLDGISIQNPEIIGFLREMIVENLKEIEVDL